MSGNLSSRGVRQRYLLAWTGLLTALWLSALALTGHLPGPWKVLLLLPWTLAALGYFQATEKT